MKVLRFLGIAVAFATAVGCGEEQASPSEADMPSAPEATLEERIARLESIIAKQGRVVEAAEKLLGAVSIDEQGDVEFKGVNVRITNGTGFGESTNGKGNLLVGYHERPAGSHNLLLGWGNHAESYGAFVGGVENQGDAPYASILTGTGNAARARASAILTGFYTSIGASSTHAALTGGNHLNLQGSHLSYGTVIGMSSVSYVPQARPGPAGLAFSQDAN